MLVLCDHHGFISSPNALSGVLGSPCRGAFTSRTSGKMSRWSPVRCGPRKQRQGKPIWGISPTEDASGENPLWYQTKLIDALHLRQLWQCKNSESLTAAPLTGSFWPITKISGRPVVQKTWPLHIVADPPPITPPLRHGPTRFPSLPLNPDSAGGADATVASLLSPGQPLRFERGPLEAPHGHGVQPTRSHKHLSYSHMKFIVTLSLA